jgi:hypothetical protein
MINFLFQFMKEHFDNLTLEPPLLYSWEYGIRFEISMPWVELEEKSNLQQIKERSKGIFNNVFYDTDEMLLVTDIHCDKSDTFLQKRPTKVYQKYIKNKELIRNLQHRVLPNVFLEDEDGDTQICSFL